MILLTPNPRLHGTPCGPRLTRHPVSRHRMECFLANFIPGTIGRCGGIEP